MKKTKIIIYGLLFILIILVIIFISTFRSNVDVKKRYPTIAVIETSLGDIEIEFYDLNAPITVSNFKSYVQSDFYKNTVFHRVIKNFMIQGGGFLISGEQKDTNNPIVLESTDKTGLSNLKGTVAMARTIDPNSATSQFFINTNDNLFLDYKNETEPGYAVFGKVISGMDVVLNIENLQTETKFSFYQNWPTEDVLIKRIYIKE
jgi:peptidyl-prolyl cis-trans isomerase B (cyclophilin B)